MNCIPSPYRTPEPPRFAIRERIPRIPESHISDIWLREALPGRSFVTSDGGRIILLSAGLPNKKDGPDFQHAVIVRDGRRLTGSIEIHRTESDWERHGHEWNPRYGRVILHVVLQGGSSRVAQIPARASTLFLAENLRSPVSEAWGRARANLASADRGPIPEELCAQTPERTRHAMIALTAAERFRKKVERLRNRRLALAKGNASVHGEEIDRRLLYECLAEALGYGGNKEPMRLMAEGFPPTFWLEAGDLSFPERGTLLLGASGLLSTFCSKVGAASAFRVRETWDRLRRAISLTPVRTPPWNLGGMRPLNAPHNRLLVLAALVPRLLDPLFIPRLWKACREFSLDPSRGARAFEKAFEIREGHFLPDYGCPGIGRERIHEIVVNVVAPILHIAGTGEEPEICTEQAVRLFFSFPSAARNRAVLQGARRLSLPFHISSGAQQGLLELQVEYCEKSRCGECLLSRGI